MSIPVALEQLEQETSRFALAPYLLTVSDDARPHAVAVAPTWEGDALAMDVGKRSASNAAARPRVSLLWPPHEPGGYSLIADGTAALASDGTRVTVTLTRAVMHRPAAVPDAAKPGCSGPSLIAEERFPDGSGSLSPWARLERHLRKRAG
jgi:hypothetical protein